MSSDLPAELRGELLDDFYGGAMNCCAMFVRSWRSSKTRD